MRWEAPTSVAAANSWSGSFSVEPADLVAAATRASDRIAIVALVILVAGIPLAIWLDERKKHRRRKHDRED